MSKTTRKKRITVQVLDQDLKVLGTLGKYPNEGLASAAINTCVESGDIKSITSRPIDQVQFKTVKTDYFEVEETEEEGEED